MRRLLLSSTGWLLVLVGLVLYPLPGPGLVVMVLGLALLSRDDPFLRNPHRLSKLCHQISSTNNLR